MDVEQANSATVSSASVALTRQTEGLSRQLASYQQEHDAFVIAARTRVTEFEKQQHQVKQLSYGSVLLSSV